MQTRILIMRPGQPHETIVRDLPEEPGYRALAALIRPFLDGAELEHVTVLADFDEGTNYQRADMFVDEMGHSKWLPRNDAATTIYRRAHMRRSPSTDPESLPPIVGPAILFDRRVWF